MSRPRVGVLGLQGDFACHAGALEALDVEAVRVVRKEHLDGLAALVMPGGESTTMLRLMAANGMREAMEDFVRTRPTLGTCAGLILLGQESTRLPYPPLAVLDVGVERNAYGRQIDSFTAEVDAPVVGGRYPGVFIRAPRIRRVGAGVTTIATLPARNAADPEPVAVRQGHLVGLCFHPELTGDRRFHRWFLTEVAGLECANPPAESGRSLRVSARAPARP